MILDGLLTGTTQPLTFQSDIPKPTKAFPPVWLGMLGAMEPTHSFLLQHNCLHQ
jgi:hypothetical protein